MSVIRDTFEKGDGILQLTPTWVPRPFNRPGRRLRLHPDDLFAMGMERGAIVERWFSSITHSETKGAGSCEGMSFVNIDDNPDHVILFKDFVDELGAELIGNELMKKYGTWPMYSKFYDYEYPLFHHIHHAEAACRRVGVKPKHEHYFFPKQYNQTLGSMPVSYFGFDASVTKEEVIERLRDFTTRDIRITELSRAYRLELDTGWYTPAGVVHAPGSLCTYEPQWNSDVMAIWENVVNGEVFHYRDKNGLECDAVVHLRNGSYGLIEIKLGGDTRIEEGAANLNALEKKIDTTKMKNPSFKMVLTAVGQYAYMRKDGVMVVPIGCLKD